MDLGVCVLSLSKKRLHGEAQVVRPACRRISLRDLGTRLVSVSTPRSL